MRKLITGGTIFYMLDPGERLTSEHLYCDYSRQYVTWPKDGTWKIRHRYYKGWEVITDAEPTSENEAFNIAYQHFIDHPSY